MDELIKSVAAKTGLPAEQAKSAAMAVISFLKDKLPGPIGGQLDQFLSGGGGGSIVDDVKKGLGGLLGK